MIKAVAATGQLGTGFKAHTLAAAAVGADFIGCDAGSSDPGPYYLGSGQTQSSEQAVARDLELMISEGRRRGIPVLVGSAGIVSLGQQAFLGLGGYAVFFAALRLGWNPFAAFLLAGFGLEAIGLALFAPGITSRLAIRIRRRDVVPSPA